MCINSNRVVHMVDKLTMTTLEKEQTDILDDCESCCSKQELYLTTYTFYRENSGQTEQKSYLCIDCYNEQLAEIKEEFGR